LRFAEFTEEWEENYISEVISSKSKKYNPETNDVNYHSIELESLSQDSGELLSTFDSKNQKSIKNVFTSGDVLFGKLRPYLKKYYLADFDGVCSSEIWVLKSSVLESNYLFGYIQSNSFITLTEISSGSKMPRADWNLISSSLISYPSNLDERRKIGEIIHLINSRIHTQKKIIEDLQITKKIASTRLFNKGFSNKDKYNFKKLGDLTYVVNKKNKENLKLPVYSINNKKGFVTQSEQFEGVDSDERGYDISLYKIIDKETFAYNPARINVGSIGYSRSLENIIVSSLYVCFKTTDEVNDEFLFQYLKTDLFKKDVLRNVEGGVRDYLFYENFSRIKVNLPNIDTQNKIANFLKLFDEKINLENEILKQYENQKKYLLSNLFV
jgi:type I restriction enzyme S subunit